MIRSIKTIIFDGFDDPRLGAERWDSLLPQGDTNCVNMTWAWQKTWWEFHGHGDLLLVGAYGDDDLIAVAPFFSSAGMIFNLCPEDYLDFIGAIHDERVLDALLERAIQEVSGFLGFRLYFLPDSSSSPSLLKKAARRLGLTLSEEVSISSPRIEIFRDRDWAVACTRKKSLRRHENYFHRMGKLTVRHSARGEDITPDLDHFFDQHISRRAATEHPSLFEDPNQRSYYRKQVERIDPHGWLRFTRLDLDGHPIAFHFGLCYRGRYLYGIPTFDINLAKFSPGEVLLRQLLLAAIEEGAQIFDFGVGDEEYKYRFADADTTLRTYGLYPD